MTEAPPDQWLALLASWSAELLSTTGRIRNLIGHRHEPTAGGYLETLLRHLLRRVLPDRYRVSTGFIYNWGRDPSRQIDVLIWDPQNHVAHLEQGELVILAPEAVAAIIEVKTTLNTKTLDDAIDLLYPPDMYVWRYGKSKTGLKRQVPDIPYRAIFAYGHTAKTSDGIARRVFRRLSRLYRDRFGEEAKLALEHRGVGTLRYQNLLDSICIAGVAHLDQAEARITMKNGVEYKGPAMAAYDGRHPLGDLAVGRFCMALQASLTDWQGGKAAQETLKTQMPTTNPGLCYFGRLPGSPQRIHADMIEIVPSKLWHPSPPLWVEPTNPPSA